jgi:hypothetical protein
VATNGFEFTSLNLIVRNKKFFDLVDNLWIKVGKLLGLAVNMGMSGDRYQPVIAASALAIGLQGFDHTDQASCQKTTGRGRGVHEDEDIEWIAILSEGRGDKAELEGEDHSFRENLCELEKLALFIEIKLIPVTSWGLNDYIQIFAG